MIPPLLPNTELSVDLSQERRLRIGLITTLRTGDQFRISTKWFVDEVGRWSVRYSRNHVIIRQFRIVPDKNVPALKKPRVELMVERMYPLRKIGVLELSLVPQNPGSEG